MNTSIRARKDVYQKTFELYERIFGYRGRTRIVSIDFRRPWFWIYLQYFKPLLFTAVVETFVWGFLTIAPFILAQAITYQDYFYFWYFAVGFGISYILGYISIYFYVRACASLHISIFESAYRYLLVIDPIHHAVRSSGEIINKINNASRSSEELCDIVAFEIVPFFVQIIVLGLTAYYIDRILGILCFMFLVGNVILVTAIQLFQVKVLLPQDIEYDDTLKQVAHDSLQQVALVRSTFATPIQTKELSKSTRRYSEVVATVWLGFVITQSIPRFLYIGASCWLVFNLMNMVSSQSISIATAIALSVMFFGAYGYIVNAGRRIEKLTSAIAKIKDLHDYINHFGGQSYPVLSQTAN